MNVKKLLYVLTFIPYFLHAQEKAINFENGLNWQEVKAKAKAENKYIFIDCFATWCGPCKTMDNEVYTDPKVADYMNEYFIAVKVQMDTSARDNLHVQSWYLDAKNIRQQFQIGAYPSFLFFSPDGKTLDKEIGFHNPEDFIRLIKIAQDTDQQYYTLLEKYRTGILDTGRMKFLAKKAESLGYVKLAAEIADEYINKLSEEDLFKVDNIWFMVEFTKRPKDRGFSVFRDHAAEIYQAERRIDVRRSKFLVDNILFNEEIKPFITSNDGQPDWEIIKANLTKYGTAGQEAYDFYKPQLTFDAIIKPALKSDPNWRKIFPLIKNQNAGKGQELLVGCSVVYYLNDGLIFGKAKNLKNFIAAAVCYDKNYSSFLTSDPLNTWAWTIFELSSERKELTKALSWSSRSIKISVKPDGRYLDTYANILYKMGRIQEALQVEKKAAVLLPDDLDIQQDYIKMRQRKPTWPI